MRVLTKFLLAFAICGMQRAGAASELHVATYAQSTCIEMVQDETRRVPELGWNPESRGVAGQLLPVLSPELRRVLGLGVARYKKSMSAPGGTSGDTHRMMLTNIRAALLAHYQDVYDGCGELVAQKLPNELLRLAYLNKSFPAQELEQLGSRREVYTEEKLLVDLAIAAWREIQTRGAGSLYTVLPSGDLIGMDERSRTFSVDDVVDAFDSCETPANFRCIIIGEMFRFAVPERQDIRSWSVEGDEYSVLQPLTRGQLFGVDAEYMVIRMKRRIPSRGIWTHDYYYSPEVGLIATISFNPKHGYTAMVLSSSKGLLRRNAPD